MRFSKEKCYYMKDFAPGGQVKPGGVCGGELAGLRVGVQVRCRGHTHAKKAGASALA